MDFRNDVGIQVLPLAEVTRVYLISSRLSSNREYAQQFSLCVGVEALAGSSSDPGVHKTRLKPRLRLSEVHIENCWNTLARR